MTDTPEMVERVATTIDAAENAYLLQADDALAGLREEPEYGFPETVGRAAIAAMREPTEAMKLAGSLKVSAFKGTGVARHHVTEVWQAMIDVALGGKP